MGRCKGWGRVALSVGTLFLGGLVVGCSSSGTLGVPPSTEPAAYDDCATTTAGPSSAIGIDPATGEQRWTRLIGGPSVGLSAAGLMIAAGSDGIIALDPATGDAVWCASEPAVVPSNVAVSDDVVAVLSTDGTLTGFDGATGALVWSARMPDPFGANLRTEPGQFLVLGNGAIRRPSEDPSMAAAVLLRVDSRSGAPIAGPVESPLRREVEGDTAVVVEQREPERPTDPEETPSIYDLVVSDAAGPARWELAAPPLMADVLIAGDMVVMSSVGQAEAAGLPSPYLVTALHAYDGSVAWTREVRFPRIFVAGGDLLVGDREGLEALALEDGRTLWEARYETLGRDEVHSEPGYFEGLASSSDGRALAGVLVATQPHRD